MPFFSSLFLTNQFNQNIQTLQVRTLPHKKNRQCKHLWMRKRVCLFTSRRTSPKSLPAAAARRLQTKNGSICLEAALSFTLFLFALVMMLSLFPFMNRQRQVQAELESQGKQLSRLAGLQEEPGEDREWIRITREYHMPLPFSVFNPQAPAASSASVRRAWIGRAGLSAADGSAGGEDQDQRYVYVGKGSTRYHHSESCHYLSNRLIPVSLGEVGNHRNQSGGKYYPCSSCSRSGGTIGNTTGTVYIMQQGQRYHTDSNCKSIIAYVRKVRLSAVEHLGPCSYCSH